MKKTLVYFLGLLIYFSYSYAGFYDTGKDVLDEKKSSSKTNKPYTYKGGMSVPIGNLYKMKECMMKAKTKKEMLLCRKKWLKDKGRIKPYTDTQDYLNRNTKQGGDTRKSEQKGGSFYGF